MTTSRTTTGDTNIIQSPEINSTTRDSQPQILSSRTVSRRPPIRRNNYVYIFDPIIPRNTNPSPDRFLVHELVRPLQNRAGRTANNVKPTLPTRYALLSVALIFILSLTALSYVYMNFPELEEEEKQHVTIPWDIEGAKELGKVLDRYKDRYFVEVLSGVFVSYIFLQTFAIPGSLFLSILSGFLFPFTLALLLVCCCSAIGASLCYMLSQLLGRRLVKKFFPERAEKWAVTVHKHKDNIFNYILFLRMTPFLPNWFINLVAPVIGVPLVPFALGTFLGVGPPSFVAIQAGQTLYKMTSSNDAFSWTSVLMLSVFAVLSLVPVVLKQRLREKFE